MSLITMALAALEQIDSLAPTDYVGALKRVRPTEKQLELLRIHMAAPEPPSVFRLPTQRHYAANFSSC
jgi:hypothetical protein